MNFIQLHIYTLRSSASEKKIFPFIRKIGKQYNTPFCISVSNVDVVHIICLYAVDDMIDFIY